MLNAIGDSLSNLASFNNEEDRENEDNDEKYTEQGKLNEDGEPVWVMGTISKMVQHCMERIPQQQMKLDNLTQLGWGDLANYLHERD
jgi:hypothetical protein